MPPAHTFQSTGKTVPIFRSTSDCMCISCFSLWAISAFVHVLGGGWLWKFHALPHHSILLRTRADTENHGHVTLRNVCYPPETCVAPELNFHLGFKWRMHTGGWFVHVCSSVNKKLEPLEQVGWTDIIKCYASCVFCWKQILRISQNLLMLGSDIADQIQSMRW